MYLLIFIYSELNTGIFIYDIYSQLNGIQDDFINRYQVYITLSVKNCFLVEVLLKHSWNSLVFSFLFAALNIDHFKRVRVRFIDCLVILLGSCQKLLYSSICLIHLHPVAVDLYVVRKTSLDTIPFLVFNQIETVCNFHWKV